MKHPQLFNAVSNVIDPIMAGFNAAIEKPSRLEDLRTSLRAENISYGELHELQTLGEQGKIPESDVELREAAGLPEQPTIDLNAMTKEELLDHANKIGDTTIRKSWTKAKIIAAIEAMSQPA